MRQAKAISNQDQWTIKSPIIIISNDLVLDKQAILQKIKKLTTDSISPKFRLAYNNEDLDANDNNGRWYRQL